MHKYSLNIYGLIFLVHLFLISNALKAQFVKEEIHFISTIPKHNSKLHLPQTDIVFRADKPIGETNFFKNFSLEVFGNKSGLHQFKYRWSNDLRSITIDPINHFQNGELITVRLLKKANQILIKELKFRVTNKFIKKKNEDMILKVKSPPPNYSITVNNNPYPANLFFATGGPPQKPVNIVDTSGALLFSQFWPKKGFDWKVNLNNHLTYFDRNSKGWFVMDSLFNNVDSVYCKNGFIADNHDFMALRNGNYVLFAYDEQPFPMDSLVIGGDPNAVVEGLIIQELDSAQNLLFQWRSWDHFSVLDNTYLDTLGSSFPFIHCNAIDIDFDGHFLISSRNLDEITKINRINGNVIWRWGGAKNQFSSINDYPFSRQHCIRSLGDNKYILYDNGNFSAAYLNGSNASRGVEYKLDTILMTAEKTWEFIHPDSIYGSSTGSIQRLPNGNTLINWGNLTLSGLGAIVSEIDTNNQLVFQLECVPGQNIYRAHKFDWFFDSTIVGCSQSSACNYNSNILIEDSSCYFKLINASISQVNDSLFASVIDGVPPYVYLWSNNASTSAISPGQSGVYWVLIEDANQCHSDTIYYQFQMTSSFGNIIHSNQTSPFKIFNILGQEVEFKYNTLLVYVYDDGTFRKRYFFKP